jgi:hypothetical protein
MPEITRITKTFTYDLPDAYLYQTNDNKLTGTFTYTGPQFMWIFINNATKKIISRFHYTERDNGADVHTPEGQTKVLVDADKDPIIASLLHNEVDYATLPQTLETFADGSTYGHPDPQTPDHTYELTEIQYDVEKGEFIKPFAWKEAHVDWEEIIRWRNNSLAISDNKIRNCNPDQVAAWEEYRQRLRDLPVTFAGVDPWKITFPTEPDRPNEPLLGG